MTSKRYASVRSLLQAHASPSKIVQSTAESGFNGGWRMAMRQPLFVRDKNFLLLLLLSWLLVWPSTARSADQIRVGYGSLSTSYAAIWVAGEAGLFRKNGINAE